MTLATNEDAAKPVNPLRVIANREIAVNRIITARSCMHSAMLQRQRGKQQVELPGRHAVGQATHKLMQGESIEHVRQSIESSLEITAVERDEAIKEAEVVAQAFQEIEKLSVEAVDTRDEAVIKLGDILIAVLGKGIKQNGVETLVWREKAMRWLFNRFTIIGQPDRIAVEVDGEGPFAQITDYKAGRLRDKDIEANKLFALMLFMLTKGQLDRLKIVVRPKLGEAHEEWVYLGGVAKELEKLSATLEDIEREEGAASAESKSTYFIKKTPGPVCFGCRIQATCKQGRRFIDAERRRMAEDRLERMRKREKRDGRQVRSTQPVAGNVTQ